MFGRVKEKEEVSGLPDETLRKLRQWQHREIMPGGSPVGILTNVLATLGRPAYLEACRELLLAMRKRFGTRTGFNILVKTWTHPRDGRQLSIEPSPRKGEDCIQDCAAGLDAIHPLPSETEKNENGTTVL
jgi:hypothetical protein